MSGSGERARPCVLEHLADLLKVPRGAIPPHVDPLPLFLTSQEAAEVLRTAHRTVLDACRRGSLPAIKIGGEWKVSHLFILAAAVGIALPRAVSQNTSKTNIRDYSELDLGAESDITP